MRRRSDAARRLEATLGVERARRMAERARRAVLNAAPPVPDVTPPGWRLTKVGRTRKAINPQGEIVSYYQYLNEQARRSGFASHGEYRKHAKQIALFKQRQQGQVLLRLGSPELRTLREEVLTPGHTPDKRAGGRLARLLEALGLRDPNATYAVGDTPRAGE
jgi:hypothetical protein